jgi:alpha-L-fucosidase 2
MGLGRSVRDIQYGRAGGEGLLLDAEVPAGRGPFPAAIIVHGGAWVSGDRRLNVQPLFAPLAAAGFAWFSISYTLARDPTTFGSAVSDVEQALRWVVGHAAEYSIDPARIVLIGESAGGQLAAMAALGGNAPPLAALVCFYAPTDLERLAATSDRIAPGIRGALAATPWARLLLARLKDLSPIHHVRPDMPPLLLIHGTNDALVPFDQSEEMCRSVRRLGAGCDLVAVRGGGHGLRWWEQSGLTTYKRLLTDWLARKGLGTAAVS